MATKRYVAEWGTYLSPICDLKGDIVEHKKLTLEEAHLYVAMSENTNLLKVLDAVYDTHVRIQRMELFLTRLFPNYMGEVRKAIAESESESESIENGVVVS